MSVTASRSVVLAWSIVATLSVDISIAAAQESGTETTSRAVAPEVQSATASHRARRAWVPPLRLRSIARMSELAPDPAAGGPARTDPRWFERHDEPTREADLLALWFERLVAPPALPCADEEPSGEIDCRAPTTVVVAELP